MSTLTTDSGVISALEAVCDANAPAEFKLPSGRTIVVSPGDVLDVLVDALKDETFQNVLRSAASEYKDGRGGELDLDSIEE